MTTALGGFLCALSVFALPLVISGGMYLADVLEAWWIRRYGGD